MVTGFWTAPGGRPLLTPEPGLNPPSVTLWHQVNEDAWIALDSQPRERATPRPASLGDQKGRLPISHREAAFSHRIAWLQFRSEPGARLGVLDEYWGPLQSLSLLARAASPPPGGGFFSMTEGRYGGRFGATWRRPERERTFNGNSEVGATSRARFPGRGPGHSPLALAQSLPRRSPSPRR